MNVCWQKKPSAVSPNRNNVLHQTSHHPRRLETGFELRCFYSKRRIRNSVQWRWPVHCGRHLCRIQVVGRHWSSIHNCLCCSNLVCTKQTLLTGVLLTSEHKLFFLPFDFSNPKTNNPHIELILISIQRIQQSMECFDPNPVFSQLELLEELGSGAFGSVHSAKRADTGQQEVAVKIVKHMKLGFTGSTLQQVIDVRKIKREILIMRCEIQEISIFLFFVFHAITSQTKQNRVSAFWRWTTIRIWFISWAIRWRRCAFWFWWLEQKAVWRISSKRTGFSEKQKQVMSNRKARMLQSSQWKSNSTLPSKWVEQLCPLFSLCVVSFIRHPNNPNCFQQVAEALAYLHSFQIAHRDLKSENILLMNKVSNDKFLSLTLF